jgi:hypothetical protein
MGCKACQGVEKNEALMIKEIVRFIQTDSPNELTYILRTYLRQIAKKRKGSINDMIISLQDFQLSLLSFTVVVGSSKSFRVLTEKFEASVKEMILNFSKYKMNPLNVICEKNHSELIKVFLPVYLNSRPATVTNVNETLDFHKNLSFDEGGDTFTSIQIACLYGSIAVVDYMVSFNKNSGMFDLEKVNEETGENCALLSVRSGSIQAVQLLHRKFSQNFFIRNIFNETALQICAICSTRRGGSGYFEVFVYLIEEVGLDPLVNFEEILIVLQDKEIVEFYEQTLMKNGISVRKREVDKDNEVNQDGTHSGNYLQVKRQNRVESNEKCSLGSSISVNSYMTDFFGGSFIGNKPWFTN